ncbi:MAG: nitroreductase family protein [Chloroflexi bacterium]|nr:nitroreductase family protein [Chloroflexota bacterium]
MSVLDVIKTRRSIRRFKKKPVPDEVLYRLKEALIWAPSAGNLQDRHFYLVYNEDLKKEIAKAALDQMFITEAPVVLIGCSDLSTVAPYRERGMALYTHHDMGASIQNLLLAAKEEGLGTCWIGAFDNRKVAELLSLPEDLIATAIVPIGYPAESPSPTPRYGMERFFTVLE